MAHGLGLFTHSCSGTGIMIQGQFYKDADINVALQTELDLTGATVSILVKFADESTEEYTGEISNFTTILATIPAEDNIIPGEVLLQAKADFGEGGVAIGATEQMFVLNSFAVVE